MSENTSHRGDEKVAEFISDAAKNPVKSPSEKTVHKYKWTKEELSIVTVLYLGSATLAVMGLIGDLMIPALIGAGISFVIAVAVTRLGLSRKGKSRLIALYDGDTGTLSVEGNGLSASHNYGNLNKATNLFVKKVAVRSEEIDPKDFLGISFGGNKKMMIPMRLVAQQPLLDLLEPYIVKQVEIRGEDKLLSSFLQAAKEYQG